MSDTHEGLLNGLDEILDPAHTALVVVDMQNDFCAENGYIHNAQGVDTSGNKPLAARIGKPITHITVRDTSSRWGSCSSAGNLSFSWRLVMAPDWIMDYVVAHEVAHLRHANHGPDFWGLVDDLGVNAKQARRWLNTNAQRLQRTG